MSDNQHVKSKCTVSLMMAYMQYILFQWFNLIIACYTYYSRERERDVLLALVSLYGG